MSWPQNSIELSQGCEPNQVVELLVKWRFKHMMFRHRRTDGDKTGLKTGERASKAIGDSLWRPYYLSRVDHVRKIRDRKQRTDIGKYLFVNRSITNWNQLPAEALGTFPCKPKIFRKRFRKAIINGVKWKKYKCGEMSLKVQWSEVRWSVVMWGEV
jgi:hypothetical protein